MLTLARSKVNVLLLDVIYLRFGDPLQMAGLSSYFPLLLLLPFVRDSIFDGQQSTYLRGGIGCASFSLERLKKSLAKLAKGVGRSHLDLSYFLDAAILPSPLWVLFQVRDHMRSRYIGVAGNRVPTLNLGNSGCARWKGGHEKEALQSKRCRYPSL